MGYYLCTLCLLRVITHIPRSRGWAERLGILGQILSLARFSFKERSGLKNPRNKMSY